MNRIHANAIRLCWPCVVAAARCSTASAQIAVRGKTVHTMAGPPIDDGMVVIQDGKITAIGRADQIAVPQGFRVLEAAVVTPGLIDAHSTVGFSGILNQSARSGPARALRADPARAARDRRLQRPGRSDRVDSQLRRDHDSHRPRAGRADVRPDADCQDRRQHGRRRGDRRGPGRGGHAWAPAAQKTDGKSPGTRGKTMAMLRAELIKAREYQEKQAPRRGRRRKGRAARARPAPGNAGPRALRRAAADDHGRTGRRTSPARCGWPRSSTSRSGSTAPPRPTC